MILQSGRGISRKVVSREPAIENMRENYLFISLVYFWEEELRIINADAKHSHVNL
ncbi:MAG TPA: hypothetical protein O0X38_00385 [Methanocorpusculum sp.]|nr:hypothetical protein [Methanocorpusculum sp.]